MNHQVNDFPTPERMAKGDVLLYKRVFKALSDSVPERLFEAGVINHSQLYCCNRFFIAWSAHCRPVGASAMRYDERVQGCYEAGLVDRISLADEFRQITRAMDDRQWRAVLKVCCEDVGLNSLAGALGVGYYRAKEAFEGGLEWLDGYYEGLRTA